MSSFVNAPAADSWWTHRTAGGSYYVREVALDPLTDVWYVLYRTPLDHSRVATIETWLANWRPENRVKPATETIVTQSTRASDSDEQRKLSDVLCDRVFNSGGAGCCDQYANMQSCRCVAEADNNLAEGWTAERYVSHLRGLRSDPRKRKNVGKTER